MSIFELQIYFEYIVYVITSIFQKVKRHDQLSYIDVLQSRREKIHGGTKRHDQLPYIDVLQSRREKYTELQKDNVVLEEILA